MEKRKVTLISGNNENSIRKEKLKVAAYCRVSSRSSAQQHSLQNQISHYEEYIRENPDWTFVGIYCDTASGLRTNKRSGYKQMLEDCNKKKIDLIIVKSLSRFGRDAIETIQTIRMLKAMNIGVYIETGRINTLAIDHSIVDIYAAFYQEESKIRSDSIKFGIQQRMKSGKAILNHSQFLGYSKGKDGVLQIVPEEAEIVRKIFELYIQGNGVRKIKRYLESNGIKTVTGKTEWSTSTIDRILSNEKYAGNILMQKTYTPDYTTGRQEKNQGQLGMYLVEHAHEPIINQETYDMVQMMKNKAKLKEN